MDKELLKNAEKLALRPYTTNVIRDETTDGEPIFLAITPELYGCLAQGDTVDKAVANLNDARVDFIYSLLEDGLPVPEPRSSTVTTTSVSSTIVVRVAEAKVVYEWEEFESSPRYIEQNRIIGASLPV